MPSLIKPTLGVMPWLLWDEDHPDPTIEELVQRYKDVCNAIYRRLDAGEDVPIRWYLEVGLC